MNIIFATDHAGFELKEHIKLYVQGIGHSVEDCGANSLDLNDDYPMYMKIAAKKLQSSPNSIAIVFGGSGQGESIVMNRYSGIRAIVCNSNNKDIIKLGREHNNANVLSIGARFVSKEEAELLVTIFLETLFSDDERHIRRIKQIDL